jgi:hypothetical protein
MPTIRLLTRGWFAFVFTNSEEVDWVLKKAWCLAGTPTLFKCWTPTFDAKRELVDEEPIWVRLPGFPMQYWNSHRFAAIGNFLGSFIEADFSFEETGLMMVARILVKLELKKGLPQEITINSAAGILYNCWIMKEFPSDAIDAMYMAMGWLPSPYPSRA